MPGVFFICVLQMLSSNLVRVVTLVKAAQTIMGGKGGFLTHNVYCSLGEALAGSQSPLVCWSFSQRRRKFPAVLEPRQKGCQLE